MNFKNEMKKTLETFGTQLMVVSNNKKFNGVGIFNKMNSLQKNAINFVNSFVVEKFSLWVFVNKSLKKIDEILNNQITFVVLSGEFDEMIGCWRLVVQKKEELSVS